MTDRPLSVCLVTDQLAAAGQTDCLDPVLCELAERLAPNHRVTILHLPPHRLDRAAQTEITDRFAKHNIRVQHPDPARYSRDAGTPAAISYGVFQHLLNMQQEFDILHFADRGGLAFHCLLARDQGLAFNEAVFALHLRGPCRWMLERDDSLFTEAAQLKTDYMERECIARADYLIGPDRQIFEWLAEKRWNTPPPERCLMNPDAAGTLDFHAGPPTPRKNTPPTDVPPPRVSLCITHYQRVEKLVDAIASVARQTYPDLELIVVDDGSPDARVQAALTEIEPTIERLGGRLLRQSNGYLGAARNAAARSATGDYLCFLDDDDIALPEMVRRLVTAATTTGADIVTGLQVPMDEARRFEAWPDPDRFPGRIDHHPLGGGPLSLAVEENVFGPATALISRKAFDRLGGYSTLKGVGHEDFELYLRAVQQGMRVELCPYPAYLYEVGRPSMISSTSAIRNFARVANEIDLTAQPENWRDYLLLGSGRRAREVDAERRHLREAGKTAGGKTPANAARTEIGAVAARQLLEERLIRGQTPVANADTLASRIQQRLHEAKPQIGIILSDLRTLARSEPDDTDHSGLVDALLRTKPGPTEELAIRVALVELLLWSGRYQQVHKLIRDILKREEANYLNRNPDVAAAIARNQVAGGLQHFLRRGETEGRQGFDSACEVANLFNDRNGSAMRLSEILRWLKAQGHAATVQAGPPGEGSST